MRTLPVAIPELAFIAATRGLAGVGIGLLLSDQIKPVARRPIGWTLLGLGVATTIPIAASLFTRSRERSGA